MFDGYLKKYPQSRNIFTPGTILQELSGTHVFFLSSLKSS